MRLLLTAAMAVGVSLSVLPFMVSSQTPPTEHRFDLNNDGNVSILDMAELAQHFGQHAEGCIAVTPIHYQTPITSVDENGSPILIEGRGFLDPTSPYLADVLAGTPVARCQ